MCYLKKLTFILFCFSFLLSEQRQFRGLNKNQILQSKTPLSFSHHIASNYDILPQQLNPSRGSYLIIARNIIQQQYIDAFSDFKKSQGFDVSAISLSDNELNVTSVQNYITDFYNQDPMLEYVLLIGDVDGFAEVPSYYYGPENDVTDQKYTHISGNDFIPDIFIGRISVDTASELAVIILKTMQYARDPLAYNSDWLNRALVVAGNYANSPPIPITPKWTSYWLRDELLEYGYSSVDTVFYPPIQQGAPYITEKINSGVGIVNYRGWGDANGWHYPEFHADDVNGLNNGWLTPVIMSYVCNSNDFANNVDPCFAEAMLRGGTTSNPKGGVAFIGPSDLHTSTKYNNVINAYMYDAMLNHNVHELGPALMAGQSGLFNEFPNQNEPGEAQEFYFHVYNILGDPSLQIYLDTPKQFSFDLQQTSISSSDGYVNVNINDLQGNPVPGAVIAIMSNDGDLLCKGITSRNGIYTNNIDSANLSEVTIYANKGGFIQGSHTISISNNQSNQLILNNIDLTTDFGSSIVSSGNHASVSFEIFNSGLATTAFTASVHFNSGAIPQSMDIDIPAIESQSSVTVNTENFHFIGSVGIHHFLGSFRQGSDVVFDFSVNTEPISLGFQFLNNDIVPNSNIQPNLVINNYTAARYPNTEIRLTSLNNEFSVSHDGQDNILNDIDPFSVNNITTNYDVAINQISYGSTLSFLVELINSDSSFYSEKVELQVAPSNNNLPVTPSVYGYWAYDNTDTGFDQSPTFEWVELDPQYGGTNGIEYLLDDDDHVDVDLPFEVKYHGETFNELTINSNGWASFVPCDIDYFWNMSIPSYMSPKALLAPFWDDLEVVGEDWIRVYTWHDITNGRFIIEWSRALNGYDEFTEETFEIIIYDNDAIPTESGDNVIDFQYLEIEDVDVTKNYSTIGIQSPDNDDGNYIVFNNNYTDGAAPVVDGRAIRFTTQSPDYYVAPLSIGNDIIANDFSINNIYPNPFNPRINFDINIGNSPLLEIFIIDILGRKVMDIYNGSISQGKYNFSWNGNNLNGKPVSSGNYFFIVSSGDKRVVRKILFLK